jgi:tetratricopeptide (TPR) repeat protein
MEIAVHGSVKRWLLLFGSCAAAAMLIFQALEIWIATRRVESGRLDQMRRGAQLLPGNGEAWDRIGRYLQLDFADPDPKAAIQNYSKAVGADPHSSFYWLDIASAYEDVGDLGKAQSALEQAEAAYPISALVSWNYGNFLVRAGQDRAGYEKIRNAVSSDPKLLPLAISRTWRSGESVDDLLNEALPANREAYLQALTFFTQLRQPDAALQVWKRLVSLHQQVAIADTIPFQDILIGNDRAGDSRRVWREALGMAGMPAEEPAGRSLVWNGNFASDFVNGGLDWRWAPAAGVSASFDSPAQGNEGRSIRIDFGGGSNISLQQPEQYIPVEPGANYHFRGWMRSDQITTDSGVQFSIIDPNHANAVNFTSDNFTGSHPWTAIDGNVEAGPQSHFLVVRLMRNPSQLFDNKITGAAWISDISLTPAAPVERKTP